MVDFAIILIRAPFFPLAIIASAIFFFLISFRFPFALFTYLIIQKALFGSRREAIGAENLISNPFADTIDVAKDIREWILK